MRMNHQTRLTSAEMASLWGHYMKDTATKCVLEYFLVHVEDREIRKIIETGLRSTEENIAFLVDLFKREHFPIPAGFSSDDVNLEAPRLFSDLYFIQNLKDMTVVQMSADTLAIGMGSRFDIIEFHEKLLNEAVQLQEMIKKVLLKKGIYVRPPYIPVPDQVEFVTSQSFLGKLTGKQRPLNVIEISHLFLNTESNMIAKDTMLAFAQVAESEEVRQYFSRGKDIAIKQVKISKQILLENDLTAPMFWDSAVTNSTVSPFSDKLMMFLVTAMSATGVGKYGASMAASPRKDLGLKYGRFLAEMSLYAEDGANIMIDKGWLEEPPHSPDHNRLIKE